MASINFTGLFNGVQKSVQLNCDYATGGQHWDIIIDGNQHDTIYLRAGKYYYHGDEFDVDDIQAIVDRITDFKGEPLSQAMFYKWGTWQIPPVAPKR